MPSVQLSISISQYLAASSLRCPTFVCACVYDYACSALARCSLHRPIPTYLGTQVGRQAVPRITDESRQHVDIFFSFPRTAKIKSQLTRQRIKGLELECGAIKFQIVRMGGERSEARQEGALWSLKSGRRCGAHHAWSLILPQLTTLHQRHDAIRRRHPHPFCQA